MTPTAFRSMGCDVVVAGAASGLVEQIRAIFERYDATFSRFRADIELVRVNAGGGLGS